MKALFFDGEPRLREIDAPHPGPGEALIAVGAAGVCRTDIEITQGYMDFRGVLGHEFVGRVLECESNPNLVGKRVVGEINIAPGARDDLERRHAPGRSVLGIRNKDGCFAERITLPAENLHIVPNEVADLSAVFVEPLAAALEVIEQVHIGPGDGVAVVGDGKLGLLVARVLVLTGCGVSLVGKHARKLAIAAGYGAEPLTAEQARGRKFDFAVDCAGSPSGLQAALALLRPMGTLVLKTTAAVPPGLHTAQLVIDEITVVGSRCGPFPPALRLLAEGLVDVKPLVEKTYRLDDGVAALEHAAKPGALKVLIDIDGSL
jgi:threonine dehydrogenase-like Zn-dependent dehydrogenase